MKSCPYCCADFDAVITKTWRFDIPVQPPSQNVVAQNKGKSRHRYKEVRDTFEYLLNAERVRLGVPKATVKRRVIITRLYTGRGQRRDRGNLIGGCKPLVDALHRTGLLVDDAEQWVDDYYHQHKCDRSGTLIDLEEFAPCTT